MLLRHNGHLVAQSDPEDTGGVSVRQRVIEQTAFGYPRDFLVNRFVYVAISPRAGGLSVGVNMNPDKKCNFDCIYCEVNRQEAAWESHLDVSVMATELKTTLAVVREGRLRERPRYHALPDDLMQSRHVALSGDGEPTMATNFVEAATAVVHVRAVSGLPFFKIVLITNATGLDLPQVQRGLKSFTRSDEVWAKLDGGTQAYLNKIDRPNVPIEKILENILVLACQRPVVIQSLFPAFEGLEPPEEEIMEYALRLKKLRQGGAHIPLVQIYSATRPIPHQGCSHLPLKVLSRIAQTVRDVAGLKAEVF